MEGRVAKRMRAFWGGELVWACGRAACGFCGGPSHARRVRGAVAVFRTSHGWHGWVAHETRLDIQRLQRQHET